MRVLHDEHCPDFAPSCLSDEIPPIAYFSANFVKICAGSSEVCLEGCPCLGQKREIVPTYERVFEVVGV